MNKDDILAKSRAENKNRDLYKEEISTNAGAISSFVALFLATVFFILDSLIKHDYNFGLYAIVVSFGATHFIIRAIRLKHKRDILLSAIYGAATLILTVVHIYQLVTAAAIQ